MTGMHNHWLVLLSVMVATMASFVALVMAIRVAPSQQPQRQWLSLAVGALAIGSGIWTMHFIGMLGFQLPVPVSYDVWLTLLSLILAVAGSGFSLAMAARDPVDPGKLIGAGTLIGIAIVSMHYTGMAAMRMVPPIRYDLPLVALSTLIAVGASMLALWSAGRLRTESLSSAFWQRAGSAVLQGSAIYGMHYTGMAAASFAPGSVSAVHTRQLLNPTTLAVVLGAASLVFLMAMLLVSAYDALRASQAEHQAQKLGQTVEQASKEIRNLSRRLVETQDAERRRLATELHDIVGQTLSALATELALIRNHLPLSADQDLRKGVADAVMLAKQSVESVRKVMAQLRPPGLDELGLPAALRWHASAFESRTGVATQVKAQESLPKPSATVEDALLRIYLEALTNIAKHAAAREVRVNLHSEGDSIALHIADDGKGFDVRTPVHCETSGWGLAIMQERAAAIGGTLGVRSAPGAGTSIEFSISKHKWA
jgi:NO-binding membrane sensor protein with MHYT domain/two-component sensor histidine kinase